MTEQRRLVICRADRRLTYPRTHPLLQAHLCRFPKVRLADGRWQPDREGVERELKLLSRQGGPNIVVFRRWSVRLPGEKGGDE